MKSPACWRSQIAERHDSFAKRFRWGENWMEARSRGSLHSQHRNVSVPDMCDESLSVCNVLLCAGSIDLWGMPVHAHFADKRPLSCLQLRFLAPW